jgi:hypothetical protein
METSIAKTENQQPVQMEPATPAHLLQLAVSNNLDVEKLEKLMQLQRSWEADQARKAFFEALNEFQAKAPEIRKVKSVAFETKTGGKTEYKYAPLADVVRQIKDTCRECGISYRWEIQDTKEEIKVTCLVTHSAGHTERTTMTVNPDASGSKNAIQARGSAIEYAKRYTLIGSLGLSTADTDTDGVGIELTLDELHNVYMGLYNEIVLVDKSFYDRGNPDNWKGERTAGLYKAAIGKARQLLVSLKAKGHD